MQLADCISALQRGWWLLAPQTTTESQHAAPCTHPGWDVITLKAISVQDHYQPPRAAIPWKVTPWKWYEGEVGRKEECSVYFLLTLHFICIQRHVWTCPDIYSPPHLLFLQILVLQIFSRIRKLSWIHFSFLCTRSNKKDFAIQILHLRTPALTPLSSNYSLNNGCGFVQVLNKPCNYNLTNNSSSRKKKRKKKKSETSAHSLWHQLTYSSSREKKKQTTKSNFKGS